MKKFILILLSGLFFTCLASAQTLPNIERFSLKTEDNCIAADEMALPVADYLFATPMITDDENRMQATAFLNRWMDCTTTYLFVIDEDITANFDDDPDLLNLYMAALTRYTLQNPDIKDEDKISIGALKQLLDYADNDNNMVLLTSRMQKLVNAQRENRLEKLL